MLKAIKAARDFFRSTFGLDRWTGDDDPVAEAKQQRLNKSAKIQTGLEAVAVGQLENIARDELAEVRQYKDQTVFGGQTKTPERGEYEDMLIADDIRVTNVKTTGVLPLLAGLAAGAAAIYFGLPYLARPAAETTEKITERVIQEPAPDPVIRMERERYDYDVDSRVIPPSD